jgi:hypothetical protein
MLKVKDDSSIIYTVSNAVGVVDLDLEGALLVRVAALVLAVLHAVDLRQSLAGSLADGLAVGHTAQEVDVLPATCLRVTG